MLWLKYCHTHVFPGDNGLSNVVDDAVIPMFSLGDNGSNVVVKAANVVDDALPYPCFPWEIMVDLMLWLKHCHTHVFPGDNG